MTEELREIPGYEDYIISNLGRVFNKKRRKFLKGTFSENHARYPQVSLFKGSNHKTFRVHQLICDAFMSHSRFDGSVINHKDGNRQNNRIDNLEWVTQAENIYHSHDTGLTNRNIRLILMNVNTGVFYNSLSECAKIHGIHKWTLSKLLSKQKNYMGITIV